LIDYSSTLISLTQEIRLWTAFFQVEAPSSSTMGQWSELMNPARYLSQLDWRLTLPLMTQSLESDNQVFSTKRMEKIAGPSTVIKACPQRDLPWSSIEFSAFAHRRSYVILKMTHSYGEPGD
jgi:hypothetical protein